MVEPQQALAARGVKIKLESLGVYLPAATLTMEELLGRCKSRPRLDLERITGVHERRVAEGEFAVDLAVKAAQRCLAMSRHQASDLGAIVCTSISKHHRPDEFGFEPATALLVRKAIGARCALTFDVVNACAGMLNGIYVLQGLIRAGVIARGMVVSGEQNLPLAATAAREVRHSLDGQLAAFTLGDCGAAIIVEQSDDPRVGFHHLDLVTGARHDHFCYSQPSTRGRGGKLITKARGFQIVGNANFPPYLKQALDATGWSVRDVHHAIPHQVSPRAIRKGVRALQAFLGTELPDYFLSCCEKYGNTTTTSHFLALHEFMLQGRITRGQNILLISGASGIVITHATLTLDDLPTRYVAQFGRGPRAVAEGIAAGGGAPPGLVAGGAGRADRPA